LRATQGDPRNEDGSHSAAVPTHAAPPDGRTGHSGGHERRHLAALRRLESRLAFRSDGGRPAREVLVEHLELARRGDIETDLVHNYLHDVVLLTSFEAYRGHTGVR
jgi:hypothetical protein